MKTVRVRIAVSVGANGHWSCCGWDYGNNTEKDWLDILNLSQENIDLPPLMNSVWVEADIPLPDQYSIDGEVSEIVDRPR